MSDNHVLPVINREKKSIKRAVQDALIRRHSRPARQIAKTRITTLPVKSVNRPGFDDGNARIALTPAEPARLAITELEREKLTNRSVLMEIPRPIPLKLRKTDEYTTPPMMTPLVFKANFFKVLIRLLVWLKASILLFSGNFKDRLLGRDSIENRAKRLRAIFEGVGGTAIKIGQQMSLRIDLLPYAYTLELSKMLDKVPPFPVEYAIKVLEDRLKQPLSEVFEAFDPLPIGSASVACVFQAVLRSGEKVAVKIRRPRIGDKFAADCRALGWVLGLLEMLSLIRPGLAGNFLFEFRNMLFEELDFTKEARYTDLFRKNIKKKFDYISAPRVYFDLSCDDVLVTEYVNGVWLGEVIAAVETQDTAALSYLNSLNIDAKTVARRLIRTNQYGLFESIFFHADPHPSNVVVQANNRLIFIDFGSCGAYTERERHVWRQLVYYQRKQDIGRMVQCAIATLEPLPPIDIDEFSKKLESSFWQNMVAIENKHSKWFERTSAMLWLSLLSLAREYSLTMNLNTLRTIRSTLLYETVASRLDNDLNIYKEISRYNRLAGKSARKRITKTATRLLTRGPNNTDYLKLEQLLDIGNRFIYLTQRAFDAAPFRYTLLINKDIFALAMLVKTIFTIALPVVLFITYKLLFVRDYGFEDISLREMFKDPIVSKIYFIFMLVVVYLNLRKVLYRFVDKDIPRDNTSGLS